MGALCSCFGTGTHDELNEVNLGNSNNQEQSTNTFIPKLAALFGQSRALPLPTTTNGEAKTEVLQGKTNIHKVEFEEDEDEDCCPTCLEGYTIENPKITTKCSHNYHLACIYEWMERSTLCPICNGVMEFDESGD